MLGARLNGIFDQPAPTTRRQFRVPRALPRPAPSGHLLAPSRPECVLDLFARISQVSRPLISSALGLQRRIIGHATESSLQLPRDLVDLVPGFIRTAHQRVLLFAVRNNALHRTTRFGPDPLRNNAGPGAFEWRIRNRTNTAVTEVATTRRSVLIASLVHDGKL
jgi:hypothetical protein